MGGTAVAHPLVAGYLRQFDAAASVLPVHRARELREQVVAHIEEAAGPDASDEEIAAVLRGLGSARVLVAEAVPGRLEGLDPDRRPTAGRCRRLLVPHQDQQHEQRSPAGR